ncbi:MAG: hypothetical protein KC492_09195 [Myxococcales bacterium]|nr:hypothetical protein [Myxococcales bacterium]
MLMDFKQLGKHLKETMQLTDDELEERIAWLRAKRDAGEGAEVVPEKAWAAIYTRRIRAMENGTAKTYTIEEMQEMFDKRMREAEALRSDAS